MRDANDQRFRVTTGSRQTKASPNLINRGFTSDYPNDLWLSNITYIPTREGSLYLTAVLDAYSRVVVGWAMSRVCAWRSRIGVHR